MPRIRFLSLILLSSLSRRKVDELIEAVINPLTASQKVCQKEEEGRSLVLYALQFLQPTDAKLQAENAMLHAKNQE